MLPRLEKEFDDDGTLEWIEFHGLIETKRRILSHGSSSMA